MYPSLNFKFLVRINICASSFLPSNFLHGLQSAPIDAEREKANAVMSRIGADLLNETKDDYESGKSSSRKDILSLLVRANDLPEAQRLRDENVVGRAYKPILKQVYLLNILSEIPTFLIAGHEATGYTHPFFRHSEIKIDNF